MSSVSDALQGRRRAILERIGTWMQTFLLDEGYAHFTVSIDKDFDIMQAKERPIITVALGEQASDSEVYGRLYPQKGITVTFPFTLFIYMNKTAKEDEDKQSHNHDLHLLTDDLYQFLRDRRVDNTERDIHGIKNIYNIITRESDPALFPALVRMIISGTMDVVRLDSP